MEKYISYNKEVKKAINGWLPIVVLESAGTFEGVSYPDNLRVAENLEKKIRSYGAVPAFTAVIDGVIKVGLTEEEKERIANPEKPLLKASRSSVDAEAMDEAITYALEQAKVQNVHGKVVTKFILEIVKQKMGKDSSEAAEQMNYSNAALAARIAVAVKRLEE